MTSLHTSRLAGLVAATLVAAAGLVGLSTAPATAALCSGSGVNVVVDFKGLGGGVQNGCDPSGAGKSGDNVFPAAGFNLEFVRGSGFVCRVESLPGGNVCAATPPANAYWGLYWSNGKSGKWTYSTSGVGGTGVPSGGFLAFSWQNGGAADPPGAAPVNNQPTATPTKAPPKPTKPPAAKPTKASKPTKATEAPKPTKAPKATKPTRTPVTSSASTTAPRAKASAPARASATASPSASPSASASASASTLLEPDATGGATPEADSLEQADGAFAPEDEPSGLPAWVPITVIVALAGAAGGVVWWRRRTGAA